MGGTCWLATGSIGDDGEGGPGAGAPGGATPAGASPARLVAHFPQKPNSGGFSKLQDGHTRASGDAHFPQKFMPAGLVQLQAGQIIRLVYAQFA